MAGETETSHSPKPDTVVDVKEQPGGAGEYVGAAGDAEVTTCESADGVLKVVGTVTNPEAEAQGYRIYVSALQDGDTRGLAQVDVAEVDGGASAAWETTMELDLNEPKCVLRVERFTL